MSIINYVINNYSTILIRLLDHLLTIGIAIPLAVGIGVPLGVIAAFNQRLGKVLLLLANLLMTIPSVALFGFMLLLLAPFGSGIGRPPTVLALILYSLLPIIRNTIVAIHSVDHRMVEAARGMGMRRIQILIKVRMPISLPIIMAGVRNAAVMGVGVTTIAYLIGSQSLGYLIFTGLSRASIAMIVVGAITVAFLGIGVNTLLMKLEESITSPGLKLYRRDISAAEEVK